MIGRKPCCKKDLPAPARGPPERAPGRQRRRTAPGAKLRYRILAKKWARNWPRPSWASTATSTTRLCDHLVVVSPDGEVVGTYRMLSPDNARRAPKLYSERIRPVPPHPCARQPGGVGRSCVHADYRTGGTIALLWSGLAQYVREHNAEYLAGCASVSLNDGGHQAASLYRKLEASHLAPAEWRVFPHLPLPLAQLTDTVDVAIPALIRVICAPGPLSAASRPGTRFQLRGFLYAAADGAGD